MEHYNKYDLLRCEFFEYLLPGMIYRGTREDQLRLLTTLEEDGNGLIHELFGRLCKEDEVKYPYEDNDFQVNLLERGGIHYIQICLPGSNPDINDVLRAYVLYTHEKKSGKIVLWRYFLVKRFWDGGRVIILYIGPDDGKLLGNDLTDRADDSEYEYWNLARNYMSVIAEEIGKMLEN